ncbi:hypothetical protein AAG570_007144 [Ranatra chinensis]|uniref:Uncharacterized protein n=1 Tax=Ranatra chinensis TaxID=642074 RepID=A0ABD0Y859_9HEMI
MRGYSALSRVACGGNTGPRPVTSRVRCLLYVVSGRLHFCYFISRIYALMPFRYPGPMEEEPPMKNGQNNGVLGSAVYSRLYLELTTLESILTSSLSKVSLKSEDGDLSDIGEDEAFESDESEPDDLKLTLFGSMVFEKNGGG